MTTLRQTTDLCADLLAQAGREDSRLPVVAPAPATGATRQFGG